MSYSPDFYHKTALESVQNIAKDTMYLRFWNTRVHFFFLPLEHANLISLEFIQQIFLKFTIFSSVFTFTS